MTFLATATTVGRLASVATAFGNAGDPDPTNNSATTVVDVVSEVVELQVSPGENSPGDATRHPGGGAVAALQFALQSLTAEDIAVRGVELVASVSADPDEEAELLERLELKIYHDDGPKTVRSSCV